MKGIRRKVPRRERKKKLVTAAMLDTLKEKTPEKIPATLEELIIEFVKKYAKYPARKEDSMVLIINTMLHEQGKRKITPDVEDVLRQTYRMLREVYPDPTH